MCLLLRGFVFRLIYPLCPLAEAADEAPRRTRVKTYHKIPKISPGSYIFQRPFWGLICSEGNLRFKIDLPSLIVGKKFTVFALFYFAS